MVHVSETPYHFELKEIQFKLIFCFISINIGVMCAGQSVTNVCSICTCNQYQTYIDCVRRKLTSIPKAIPATVETLNLYGNKIRNIENEAFKDLINLKTLSLSGNGITNIPEGAFTNLVNLEELFLYDNSITNITEGAFKNLVNLEQLYLSGNKIRNIENEAFKDLINLKTLYLSSNEITNIPEGVFLNLVNLEKLDLSSAGITNIAEGAFKSLVNLEELYLVENKIRNIEEHTFKNLVNLKYLDLSFNGITNIPESVFQNLVNLEKLDLTTNKIKIIEEHTFKNLVNLKYLYLSSNGITNIPEGAFKNLVKLEKLYLSSNGITNIPEGAFKNLVNLEILSLMSNGITNILEGVFQNLVNLETLTLWNNGITNIPEGAFKNLVNLEILHLSSNGITNITEGAFTNLVNLETLSLSTNQITNIPEGAFTNLVNLETLYLFGNGITNIPEGAFKNLVNLEELYLHNNRIKTYEDGAFLFLPSITHIDLRSNDNMTCGCHLPAMVDYLKRTYNKHVTVHGNCRNKQNKLIPILEYSECKNYSLFQRKLQCQTCSGITCKDSEVTSCPGAEPVCMNRTSMSGVTLKSDKSCSTYRECVAAKKNNTFPCNKLTSGISCVTCCIGHLCNKNDSIDAGIGEPCIQTIDCTPEFSICVNNTCGCQTNYYGDRFQCKKYKHLGEQCQPEELCFDRKAYCDDKTKRCICYPDSSEINNTCVKTATMKEPTEIEARLEKLEKLMTRQVEMMESMQSQLNDVYIHIHGDTINLSHPQPHLRHTHFHGYCMDTVEAHCDITPNTQLKSAPKVKGHIHIVQQTSEVRVYVTLCVFDADNPKEVFELHIHEFNDTSKSCDSLGGHFNPHSHQHGVADKPHVSRHAGSWGNVVANNNGIIVSQFGDKDVSLRGHDSIIGRSIVLKARADIKSDSGERLACCVISKV